LPEARLSTVAVGNGGTGEVVFDKFERFDPVLSPHAIPTKDNVVSAMIFTFPIMSPDSVGEFGVILPKRSRGRIDSILLNGLFFLI
jgi:hypothetical protein